MCFKENKFGSPSFPPCLFSDLPKALCCYILLVIWIFWTFCQTLSPSRMAKYDSLSDNEKDAVIIQ